MRGTLMLLTLVLPLVADRLTVQTMGCPEVQTFEKLDDTVRADGLKLQHFANENGCVILSPSDGVRVIYKPASSSPAYLHIELKRSGAHYFVPARAVLIEQPGEKNRFSF